MYVTSKQPDIQVNSGIFLHSHSSVIWIGNVHEDVRIVTL